MLQYSCATKKENKRGKKVVNKYIYPGTNPEKADKVLFEVLDLCKEMKIEVYLIFGTLLGIYRDGSYLFDDNDIDLFIKTDKETRERFKKRLLKQNFELGTIPGSLPTINMHTIKDQIFIDIWIKMRESLMKYYIKTKEIKYKNRMVPVPADTEGFLEASYGEWKKRIPKSANPFGK